MNSNASTPMPQYRSHKKVWALKIASVENLRTDTTTDENPIVRVHFEDKAFAPAEFNLHGKPTPAAGWYYVCYEPVGSESAYWSFSPAEAFETGYTLIKPEENPHGQWHGIGWAVKHLQNGMRIRRVGWNGKGQFLVLIPGSTFIVAEGRPIAAHFKVGGEMNYHPHVDLFNAQGVLVPWNASQGDLLATDWELVD